ncbi:hypothetical protein L6164_022337 [Bauhinia variegata]|uniref:Uncharacterized protein n=1 Tax=Bauhinia variegata TaxID=167791 RepID=A0ACB9MFU8_BAUVA|nr:hypothetical protein L6164_022337 [Bauhinia variegata]
MLMKRIRSKWNFFNLSQVSVALFYSVSTNPLQSASSIDSLFLRISRAGDPRVSMTPILNQWIKEGRDVNQSELQRIIRILKKRHRYTHALQVSEWMNNEGNHDLLPGDIARQLVIISKVHGLKQAETYFTGIPDSKRGFKVYAALLNCYAEHECLGKAEDIFQKLKQYRSMYVTVSYNVMLNLYTRMGKYEKLDSLMQEMKEKDICNSVTFTTRLNAYAATSDVEGMEKFLRQMEVDPFANVDWYAYAIAANCYLNAGQFEKTMAMLKRSENSIKGNISRTAFECILTMYATIGSKDEVYRIWNLYKKLGRSRNAGYLCMLSSLMKLDDISGAERILEEWESGNTSFDLRIPNFMISAYCKKGLLEKAEAFIGRLLERGKELDGSTWNRLASGYCNDNDVEKAVETMKKALLADRPVLKRHYLVNLVACIDRLKENGNLELAVEILKLSKEQGYFSAATYDRLLSYLHNEISDINALNLTEENHPLGKNDQVSDGETGRTGAQRGGK